MRSAKWTLVCVLYIINRMNWLHCIHMLYGLTPVIKIVTIILINMIFFMHSPSDVSSQQSNAFNIIRQWMFFKDTCNSINNRTMIEIISTCLFLIYTLLFEETEDESSLKTLSFVGVVISIAFIVLTFTIFIVTWK